MERLKREIQKSKHLSSVFFTFQSPIFVSIFEKTMKTLLPNILLLMTVKTATSVIKVERHFINTRTLRWPLIESPDDIDYDALEDFHNHYDVEEKLNLVPKIKRPGPLLTMFPKPLPHPNNLTEENSGKPLILTPLLEAGKIDEAQDLAKVRGLSEDVTSYSGFFTTNKEHDSNLFFWYFPSKVKIEIEIVVLCTYFNKTKK